VTLFTGPTSFFVRWVMWFPDALRPGIFLAIVFTLIWVLATRGVAVWNWSCRAVAIVLDVAVGVVLLPEFALTTHRRRRGRMPGAGTVVFGQVAERALDGAATLYTRHDRPAAPSNRSYSWVFAIILIAVPAGAWIVRDQAPHSGAADAVTQSWKYWGDVERWANGDSSTSHTPTTTTSTTVAPIVTP
jgi:hypothetical protein